MARTPLGIRPQPDTQTALFAYFAARLKGIPGRQLDEYFDQIGLALRTNGARRAAFAARYRPPLLRSPGRRPTSPSPDRKPTGGQFRDWLLIDELGLGLDLHLVRFPGNGRPQHELLRRLEELAGIRQIIDTGTDRTVYAVVTTNGPVQRRSVRAALEEVVPVMFWDEILAESSQPGARTWESLAQLAAAEEGLEAASSDRE